ncbi:MAG TPA: hypothetical protein VK557_03925 [Pyrinomonadaceae bacterium]|nr:hypothetical protein [Pyrinomonadaceae bacterium]
MEYPELYWHCFVRLRGAKGRDYGVVNDLVFSDLDSQILNPWRQGVSFPIAGKIISSREVVEEIKITHTPQPKQHYADRHYARMRDQGIADWSTDSRKLPITNGKDFTHELLFADLSLKAPKADAPLVIQICSRIARVAQILAVRDRSKPPFIISDEYDVQDLLDAVLRGYLKYSVREEPLGKVAGARSGRADIAIEELGVIIEVKFVRSPHDQKKLVEDFAHDLLLYTKWSPLRHFIYLCYNSSDLRDSEALQQLEGPKDINGTRFETHVVLA